MFTNQIEVTKHAIERYQYRIDQTLSKKEAEEKLKQIVKDGSCKKLRECVFEKDAVELICEKDGITVLVIAQKIRKKNIIFKKKTIITCLGDTTTTKWYKNQNKKSKKRAFF